MDIGQNIKIARKRAQLTQKQLSELSNVAAVTIQQYETGKRQPQIEQLLKLADALHVTLEEILGISSNRFKVPITSDLLQTLDWYARKNNRSLYEEVDIAIDTYLDGLSMQGLLSDEDDSLEMGPPPERYELFFPDMMALIASETIEQLQESPLKDYLCKNPSMFKELKDVANESLRQPIIQVIGQNIIPLV